MRVKTSNFLLIFFCTLLLQDADCQTIEIHHISVGDGDATLIKVNTSNAAHPRPYSILIDAGKQKESQKVASYLFQYGTKVGDTVVIDYLITSHFHLDHYGGLIGSNVQYAHSLRKRASLNETCGSFRTGLLEYPNILNPAHPKADSVLFPKIKYFALLDRGSNLPQAKGKQFRTYTSIANQQDRRIPVGAFGVGDSNFIPSIHPPSNYDSLPDSNQHLGLGGFINLGLDNNGVPVKLRLVLADGKAFLPQRDTIPKIYNIVDTILEKGGVNARKIYPNENNWELAWVLEYGEFRYFTGGDIGGYSEVSPFPTPQNNKCRQYLNLEIPVCSTLIGQYNPTDSSRGHICTVKLSHHGSWCSTNPEFLKTLKPSVAIISCGKKTSYGFPRQDLIARLDTAHWSIPKLVNDSLFSYFLTSLHFEDREFSRTKGRTSGSEKWVVTDSIPDSSNVVFAGNGRFFKVREKELRQKGNIIIKVMESTQGKTIQDSSCFTIEYMHWLNNEPPINVQVGCHAR